MRLKPRSILKVGLTCELLVQATVTVPSGAEVAVTDVCSAGMTLIGITKVRAAPSGSATVTVRFSLPVRFANGTRRKVQRAAVVL